MADESIPKRQGVELRRVLLDPSPPRAAHAFGWSRVGEQFQIELGYLDLQVVGELLKNKKNEGEIAGTTDWYITDRFILDTASVERLIEIVKLLSEEYERFKKAQRDAIAHAE